MDIGWNIGFSFLNGPFLSDQPTAEISWGLSYPYATHGAGIFTYKTGWFWTRANVGKYTSTMGCIWDKLWYSFSNSQYNYVLTISW